MTTEEYMTECRSIHARLKGIAEITRTLAETRCATPDNRTFNELCEEQRLLLEKLSNMDSLTLR